METKKFKTSDGSGFIIKRLKVEEDEMAENLHSKDNPKIEIEAEMLPALQNWKVGKKYTVTFKMKMVGRIKNSMTDCGLFEVIDVENDSAEMED